MLQINTIMKDTYILINVLFFIFTLSNYLTVHCQVEPKEPLAKLWNIENDEIPQYLSIEKNLSMVDGILKPLLDDDNFGGTYIDVIQNMIFVNTLNFTKVEQIKNLTEIRQYINLLNFIRASNSTAKLSSRFQDIYNLANSLMPKECMGYINSKTNNIIIATCNESRNESSNIAFINAINDRMYYPIFIYYNCRKRPDNVTPSLNSRQIVTRVLAGDGIIFENAVDKCSIGFWARIPPNENFIATAGHCYEQDAYYFLFPWNSRNELGVFIGTMQYYFEETIDFGLISIDNDSDIQPVPSIRNTDSEQYKELFIDDVILVSSNGAHLCFSGVFSHVKCGYVAALNGFATDGDYFRENLFIIELASKFGDSGGPVFSYKNLSHVSLNGILSSGVTIFMIILVLSEL
ncbi:hypothetical protein C2G38_1716375 [Gigaspora rosea]|uniref:Peptidase S1 domain-containing protein n=1 Tax=Gigaspora rosea TaxID=44941 RepID=A0A397UTW3_9GLOM|nr:hypothetical protein C2G38_1716375 [Gigaspora rosea]